MTSTRCTFYSILLRIKGLYMFRALLFYPREALNKRHLVYCVRVMSVGCGTIAVKALPEDEQVILQTGRGPYYLIKLNEKCITLVSLYWFLFITNFVCVVLSVLLNNCVLDTTRNAGEKLKRNDCLCIYVCTRNLHETSSFVAYKTCIDDKKKIFYFTRGKLNWH
jgi:hypothetical protein